MVIYLVRSFGSLNVCFRINERTCVANFARAIESPRFYRLEGSELLTSEFLRFRSRLNETSGRLGKIGAVSGSDYRATWAPMWSRSMATLGIIRRSWLVSTQKKGKHCVSIGVIEQY